MATTYHNQLQQLYVAYFNRPADPAGLAFYEGVLEANASNATAILATISADFAASAEYKTEYNQLTNTGVVTQVYQNLFGRAPDTSGLNFWVNALNTGNTTVAKMVTDIAAGAQTTDKVAFESKVLVATAFTNALNTEAEVAGFNTEKGLDAAKALITTIKTAAQATAAIEPATLDASVAAVVKAGTPFTLTSGLAALNVATEARAEFLEEFDTDVDGDLDVDADDIAENVVEAQTALEALVADPLFAEATTSAGVKAALLADQIEANNDAVVVQQKELSTARAAVEKVTGLSAAIAEATAAAEASDEAATASIEANSTLTGAAATLESRYTAAALDVTGTGLVTATVGGVANTPLTTVNANGTIKVATGVDASKWVGLTAVVTAFNANLAATADAAEAAEAERFAQLAVEVRDVSSTADANDVDGASTLKAIPFASGDVTVKTAGKPTFAELMDEMSALAAEGDAAKIKAFDDAVTLFLSTNTSPLASAVAAEEEDVADAQDAVTALADAVAAVEEAEELAAQLESLDEAIVAAEAEFVTNGFKAPVMLDLNRFGTSGSDIFVASDADVTISSFGRAGDDVLYVGSGFKLNASGDLDDGVNADLEVFFIQSGSNTIVTIETKAFGSESGDVVEITLTGVDADDLTFNNGIISI